MNFCPSGAGAGGGGGGGGDNQRRLSLTWANQEAVTGTTETVIAEWNENFSDLSIGNIQARFSALVKRSAGTGTYNLRIGGTIGNADGTIRATLTSSTGSYVQSTTLGAVFVNPTGQQLVKVTADNTGAGNDSFIRGLTITLREP